MAYNLNMKHSFKFLDLPKELQYKIIKFSICQLPEYIRIKHLRKTLLLPLIHVWYSSSNLVEEEEEVRELAANKNNIYKLLERKIENDLVNANMKINYFEVSNMEQIDLIINKLIEINHKTSTINPTFIKCIPPRLFALTEDHLSKIKTYWDQGSFYLDMGTKQGLFKGWGLVDIIRYCNTFNLEKLSIISSDMIIKVDEDSKWNCHSLNFDCCSIDEMKFILKNSSKIKYLRINVINNNSFNEFKDCIKSLENLLKLSISGFSQIHNFHSQSIESLHIVPPMIKDISCYTRRPDQNMACMSIKNLQIPKLNELHLSILGSFPLISELITDKEKELLLIIDGFTNNNSLTSMIPKSTLEFLSNLQKLVIKTEGNRLSESNIFHSLSMISMVFPNIQQLTTPIIHQVYKSFTFHTLKSLTVSPVIQDYTTPCFFDGDWFPVLETLQLPMSSSQQARITGEIFSNGAGYFEDLLDHNIIKLQLGSLIRDDVPIVEDFDFQNMISQYFQDLNGENVWSKLQSLIVINFPKELITGILYYGSPLIVGKKNIKEMELVFSYNNIKRNSGLLNINLTDKDSSSSSFQELESLILTVEEIDPIQIENDSSHLISVSGFTCLKKLIINLKVEYSERFIIDTSKQKLTLEEFEIRIS